MRRFSWLVPLVSISIAALGCGGGSTPTADSPANPQGQVSPAPAAQAGVSAATAAPPVVLPVNPNSSPQEVVAAFLNAMRDGNSGIAGQLLTEQAQSETTKHQWPVQPPGAPTATYQIGNPTFHDATQTTAQIPCVWNESDGAGGTVAFEVTWALRKGPQGWRVAGFATEIIPDKDPYYFNFEDIAQLRQTQAEAEAAMEAAYNSAPAAEVAEQPASSTPAARPAQ